MFEKFILFLVKGEVLVFLGRGEGWLIIIIFISKFLVLFKFFSCLERKVWRGLGLEGRSLGKIRILCVFFIFVF